MRTVHPHAHEHTTQVETIGDAYMVICGAPELTPNHAEYVTDFAFSIIEATSKINDPSTKESLKIRVGECFNLQRGLRHYFSIYLPRVCVCVCVCVCVLSLIHI